jgi:ribosomal protein L16 Arg81 hydroxylase
MTLLTDRGTAAQGARPSSGLSRLIAPMDPAQFLAEYWERQPLVLHRDDPMNYADLLTLDDLDNILAYSSVRPDDLRVVIDGKEIPVAELGTSYGRNGSVNAIEALYECYRGGSTIILNALDERWAPLKELSHSLGARVGARFQMNVYLTPAGSQGFKAHYDTHDVFVLQVHGVKRWRLYGAPYALPLTTKPHDKLAPEPEEAEQEFDLARGDTLYLPRGTMHAAAAQDSASVHITVGVHPVLYASVLKDAMNALFDDDVRFRGGLPVGFVTDPAAREEAAARLAELIDVLRERLAPAEMVDTAARETVSISSPLLRHHLTDLEEGATLDVATRVRRRPGLQWHLSENAEAVELEFHNKTVRLPAHVADEVRFIAESNGDGVAGSAIPGDLDDPGRLVLVRTLLREGFLTLA